MVKIWTIFLIFNLNHLRENNKKVSSIQCTSEKGRLERVDSDLAGREERWRES